MLKQHVSSQSTSFLGLTTLKHGILLLMKHNTLWNWPYLVEINHIDESTSQKLLFQSNFSFPRTSIVPQHQWTTHNGAGAERKSSPSEQYQRPLVEHAEYEPAVIRESPIFFPRALLLIPFYGGMEHLMTLMINDMWWKNNTWRLHERKTGKDEEIEKVERVHG